MKKTIQMFMMALLFCTSGTLVAAPTAEVITVKEGEDIVFKVAEKLSKEVWIDRESVQVFKGKKELSFKELNGRMYLENGCVIIKKAVSEDAGNYTIKVKNNGKVHEYKAEVKVVKNKK